MTDERVKYFEALADSEHYSMGSFAYELLDEVTRLRSALTAQGEAILNAHWKALPPNWVYTDSQTTLDLLVAEITTLRFERDKRDEAIRVAEEAPHGHHCSAEWERLHGPRPSGYDWEIRSEFDYAQCNCWKAEFSATLSALAAGKEKQ